MEWVSPRGSLQQPLQALVDGVLWLSLEDLGQQAELKRSTQTILDRWPKLLSAVLTMFLSGFPHSPPRKSWCSPAFLPTNYSTLVPPRTFWIGAGRKVKHEAGRKVKHKARPR